MNISNDLNPSLEKRFAAVEINVRMHAEIRLVRLDQRGQQ
jgi:hypothetical protein